MNKFTKYDEKEFKKLIGKSVSIRYILLEVGYKTANGSGAYTIFKNECIRRGIDIPKYNFHGVWKSNKKIPDEKVFIVNSTYPRGKIKNRIIKGDMLEYVCRDCDNIGQWNGKKISLHLEHINGINNDHRLINLCFLCPNCHSQTPTYAGKSLKKTYLCECGCNIYKNSKRCRKCNILNMRKNERPVLETLKSDIENIGYSGTGRKYNVSPTTIKKWLKTT